MILQKYKMPLGSSNSKKHLQLMILQKYKMPLGSSNSKNLAFYFRIMQAARSKWLSPWLTLQLNFLLLSNYVCICLQISIRMEPNGSPKCPGDSVTLYCNHTKTTHNPGWRVRGNGLPQFGFAQFGVEPLVGHSLEQSDLVEEILTIATVQPKFDGFTYTCLYSIIEGNVISDPAVVLQVINVLTPIRGLQISGILDTSAHLSWEHDDPCVAVDHYEILVTPTGSPNSKSMPPYSSDILSFTLTNLISETSYKTEISVVTKDGNKSQAMIINFRTSVQLASNSSEVTAERIINCTENLEICAVIFSCILTVLIIIVIFVVVGLLLCFLTTRRRKQANKTSCPLPCNEEAPIEFKSDNHQSNANPSNTNCQSGTDSVFILNTSGNVKFNISEQAPADTDIVWTENQVYATHRQLSTGSDSSGSDYGRGLPSNSNVRGIRGGPKGHLYEPIQKSNVHQYATYGSSDTTSV